MNETQHKKTSIGVIILSAIAITVLLHRQQLGLNVVIVELLALGYLIVTKQFRFQGKNRILFGIGCLVSLLFTLVTHSIFAYVMHFIALFVLIGVLIYPEAKSMMTAISLATSNLFRAQGSFFRRLSTSKLKGLKLGNMLWRSRIFTVPILIILVFLIIYSFSNPVFSNLLANIGTFIERKWLLIFKDLDLSILFTLLVGLLLSNFIFLREQDPFFIGTDQKASDLLTRLRLKHEDSFKFTALKNEYKAGIFLLFTLNAILLTVNIIDVNWVWFNFDWQAQDLKQFVHEGTYLLILSILISVAIVFYYFRRNLNFIANNRLLKTLSYVWLGQNALLALSVAVRNFYYIGSYSLAYKRIGVIIFLILTLHGLYTVSRKVHGRKSVFYLLRTNALAMYIVLMICSFINWDTVIAKYNFSHASKSFVHYNFLADLSDKTLPDLDKSMDELAQIHAFQKVEFAFAEGDDYMPYEDYYATIQNRKALFIERWEAKNILEWNLPEYLAYRSLKGGQ